MFIVNNRKIFYTLSIVLFVFSMFAVAHYGLNFGIDFKGGSILQVEYGAETTTASSTAKTSTFPASTVAAQASSTTPSASTTIATIKGIPSIDTVKSVLASLNIGEVVVRQAGDTGFIIRTRSLSPTEQQALLSVIGGKVKQFDAVGPVLGQELQGKAVWSIILVVLAILIFITFVFRKVSKPVASWKYGLVAIVALFHDVFIPVGIFAYLGRNGGFEIDALFVTAILVILGFSVHDTIVVFDRTRENLRLNANATKKPFSQIVGESVRQTLTRSVNTSLTTVLALVVLYMIGPDTTRNFALALIIGIITGTYSSIFIGSPLLVTLEKWQKRG